MHSYIHIYIHIHTYRFNEIFGEDSFTDFNAETLPELITTVGSALLLQDQVNGFNGFLCEYAYIYIYIYMFIHVFVCVHVCRYV